MEHCSTVSHTPLWNFLCPRTLWPTTGQSWSDRTSQTAFSTARASIFAATAPQAHVNNSLNWSEVALVTSCHNWSPNRPTPPVRVSCWRVGLSKNTATAMLVSSRSRTSTRRGSFKYPGVTSGWRNAFPTMRLSSCHTILSLVRSTWRTQTSSWHRWTWRPTPYSASGTIPLAQNLVSLGDVMACLRCVTPHGQSIQQALEMSGSFHKNVTQTTMRPISVWTTQESSVTELRSQASEPQSVTVWRASGIPDELPYTPWYPLAMMETVPGYPDPYATGDPDHLDMSSAFWTFRLFVTAVDCDYARRIAEVQAVVLPLEKQAMAVDKLLQNMRVDTDTSRETIARLLTACGEGLGMEALSICRELLRQWQTNSCLLYTSPSPRD